MDNSHILVVTLDSEKMRNELKISLKVELKDLNRPHSWLRRSNARRGQGWLLAAGTTTTMAANICSNNKNNHKERERALEISKFALTWFRSSDSNGRQQSRRISNRGYGERQLQSATR